MQRRRWVLLFVVASAAASVVVSVPVPTGTAGAATSGCQPRTSTGPLPAVTAADAGRLVMASLPGPTLDPATEQLLHDRHLGGVLLFGRSIRTAAQLTALDKAIHAAAGARRTVISTDQEGGTVRRIPFADPAPSARAQASMSDTKARALWVKAGKQLHALGIDLDLAPVVDLALPGSFEGTRAASANPDLAGRVGTDAVEGLLAGGTGSTAKHFPGLGGTKHSTDDQVVHAKAPTPASLKPFRSAVRAGTPVVMVDLAIHQGLGTRPAAFAPKTYALLRGSLGFDGVAMTDALDAAAARSVGPEAQTALAAICAGADMVIAPGSPAVAKAVIDAIAAAVKSGRLPHARFAEAVRRVDTLARRPAHKPTPLD
ncbi:MAG TPA: glycoside hydrolase family 3 N-terminal domain-containing protein [Mycobacteriales bacterium]|nr:glycoside hydrolase family 3 N-terminal domain-containing protein [Mycobacteriales bacterium]